VQGGLEPVLCRPLRTAHKNSQYSVGGGQDGIYYVKAQDAMSDLDDLQ
jgi:hypothetical protein